MRAIYSFLLSSIAQDYETVRTLKSSERGCVSLLQNRQNGTRFIFRHYRGNGEVYRKLLGISCPNLPQIMEAAEQDGITQTDERADIYSLGVLLNIMLTGKHPSRELASGRLGRIVQKCTMVNPEKRYKSALYLMEAL